MCAAFLPNFMHTQVNVSSKIYMTVVSWANASFSLLHDYVKINGRM